MEEEVPKKKSFFEYFFSSFSSSSAKEKTIVKKVPPSKFSSTPARSSTGYPKRIFTDDWDTKPPCAVIVTIYANNSFDEMFRSVKQQSPDPESSIAVFEMDYNTIPLYLQFLERNGDINTDSRSLQSTIDAIKDIVESIQKVEPDSVVFNFECCGQCSDNGFNAFDVYVMQLLQVNINSGYMTMFADYSLKALIKSWDEDVLGPQPFHRLPRHMCGNSILLAFDSAKLLECPSSQLQNVGKLHEGINTAQLHCLSGTIVFTINEEVQKKLASNPAYELDVLTVATKIDQKPVTDGILSVDRYTGHAGHVLLTYNNAAKGKILVSAGHWIELSQMGADTERVFVAMREQFGAEYEEQLRTEYSSAATDEMRSEFVQRSCRQLVQSSAPCKYTSTARKIGKKG